MFRPNYMAVDDVQILGGTIQQIGFGQLITHYLKNGVPAFEVTPMPVIVRLQDDQLRFECHVARSNPHWKFASNEEGGGQSLFIFQGPQAYVSPSHYPTKAEDGKAVPTWNYITVQAEGGFEAISDGAWLQRHVTELSELHEAGRDKPWTTSDAPVAYIAALKRGIVGLNFTVTEAKGTFKLGQEKPQVNQQGIIKGLSEEGDQARDLAEALAGFQRD